jgi:hypothetical protein
MLGVLKWKGQEANLSKEPIESVYESLGDAA